MKVPKVVSLDCAQTILEVDWSIKRYVADICAAAGLEIPLEAPAKYEAMYAERLMDYVAVNMTRDYLQCERWWIDLGRDWLQDIGLDGSRASELQAISNDLGFGPNSILFKPYEDVAEALAILRRRGIRLAVLSNWDYSLNKALRAFSLDSSFDLVVASLEHGIEKPDPRLFRVVSDFFGVEPGDVLHIGDNPLDDYEGARGAGMRAALIDRSRPSTEEPCLSDLRHVEEAFNWIQ